jgi:HEAT repeat protein
VLPRSAITFVLLSGLSVNAQPDLKEKVKAARELGKAGSSAIPQLKPYLTDPEREVRLEAVKALVSIGTQYSLDPLIEATSDNDSEIQMRAVDGLVNFYSPGHIKSGWMAPFKKASTSVKGRFTDTDAEIIAPGVIVRPEVIVALGKVARGGTSMESRANAAQGLGILRGREAGPDLLEALRSKDDAVIFESLTALQKIRDPATAQGITFLIRDPKERIQIAAIETCGILLNRAALPDLRAVVEKSKSIKVRRSAIGSIAMMPEEADRQLFHRYFADKDDGLRAASAEGYGRLKNPADLSAIEQAFQNERKMAPRLSAAFAAVLLGRHELTEFSPLQYLVNTLNSKSYDGVARPFLTELTRDEDVRRAIYPAVAKGNRLEKIALAQILAVNGDKDTIPVIEPLKSDSDLEVVDAATKALTVLRSR